MQDANDPFNFGSNQASPMQLMSMAEQGQQALDSGAVSIKEAKALQKKLGLDSPEGAQDFLSNYLGFNKQENPYLFGPQAEQVAPTPEAAKVSSPQLTVPVRPSGLQRKTEKSSTEATRQTRYLHDFDAIDMAMNKIRNTPEFQEQLHGIHNLEDQFNMAKRDRGPRDEWVRPLLAFTDAINGTHQADSFMPRQEKRDATLQKFADDVQKRRSDLSKTMIDAFAKLKTGNEQTDTTHKLAQALSQGDGLGGRGGAYMRNLPVRAGQDFDRQLKVANDSVEALNRGDSFLNDSNYPLTYQDLNRAQQDITKGLVGAGVVSDSKTMLDLQQVFDGAMLTLKTKYTGKFDPKKDDLRKKVPDVVAQINRGLQKIRGDFNDSINRQADQIASTYRSSYADIPNLRETVEDKLGEIKKRHPRSEHFNPTGHFQASAGGKIKVTNGSETLLIDEADLPHALADKYTVVRPTGAPQTSPNPPKAGEIQDGHRFKGGDPKDPNNWQALGAGGPAAPTDDVNTDLNKLTPEQVQIWMQKHGGR